MESGSTPPAAAEVFFGPGSDKLRSQSCGGACSRDTPKLSDEELDSALVALPAWRAAEDRKSITRSFVAKNFVKAIEFFDRVAEVAEGEGHHPDLHLTSFRNVSVTVSTHAVDGLTQPDIILAAKLDAVPVEYSPKWLREHSGQPAKEG